MKASELIHKGLYKCGEEIVFFYALNGQLYQYNENKRMTFYGCLISDAENGELSVILTQHDKSQSIDPIPLTEAILKANGFRFTDLNSVGLRYQYYGVKSLQVVVEKEEEEDAFGHYQRKIVTLDNECIYVHELQHALRLCGLNDLADNFKVEL